MVVSKLNNYTSRRIHTLIFSNFGKHIDYNLNNTIMLIFMFDRDGLDDVLNDELD